MFLKLMKRDGPPYDYTVIEVQSVSFRRQPKPTAILDEGRLTERSIELEATAYLVSDTGKTIDTFAYNPRTP